ncbi:MAG: clan AA aspartic protease [bacterium]|nr:clan AA aspartic protease [bacterium]
MGAIHASVIVRNPTEPDKAWEGKFLVDTGAMDSLVPRSTLVALGLKPRGRRIYEMADGTEVTMDVTTAEVEIMGQIAGATILFGEDDTEPLLGVTVLQSARIAIDPASESLYKRRSSRL